MAAAAAVVTPSGLEDGVSRSRGEGAGEVVVERGPGAAYHMFVVMEDLVEKLKLLRYEEELLRKNNLKPPSRHYFALPTNPGEQFYMFCTLAAWLINKAGHLFEQPQEYDDPNATISNILSELRSFGRTADFPPSKLKSGYGEHVCYVLDCLAEEALKYIGFTWKRPAYPVEELEEETVPEDDAELTLTKVDEEFVEEETDNEENFIDLNVLKAQTYRLDMNESAKQEDILESTTDAAEWSLEVERVLPQLKVTIRTDNKHNKKKKEGKKSLKRKKRPKWMSEETLKLALQSQVGTAKETNNEAQELNRRFQRVAQEDRVKYYNDMCKGLEIENQKGRTRSAFLRLKEWKKKFKPRVAILKGSMRKMLNTAGSIKKRWKEYTALLYQKKLVDIQLFQEVVYDQEPMVLKEEVQAALEALLKNKASGIDGIPIEIFQ
ncbi:intraflagellar transport protein 57 homolog isoform 1-T1 [Trichechus inunguis]